MKNKNGDTMVYLYIFISKILENTLATLRIIVVANGKKKLGALLQGLVATLWILVTGIIIKNINKDIFKIIIFIIGSMVGSYTGSILEEKIALGNILIIINSNNIKEIKKVYNKKNIITYKDYICFIEKRRKVKKITHTISKIDNNCKIITQRIKINYDKLTT